MLSVNLTALIRPSGTFSREREKGGFVLIFHGVVIIIRVVFTVFSILTVLAV